MTTAEAIVYRDATLDDLPVLIRMLADDAIGATREVVRGDSIDPSYVEALRAIANDPNHTVLLATSDDAIVGMLQLSFLPCLTHAGSWRAQVEGVRVASTVRGTGVGQALLAEAVRRAHERGCRLVQLTTDKRRPEAIRFYERLGFSSSHEGMKLTLGES